MQQGGEKKKNKNRNYEELKCKSSSNLFCL